MGDTFREPAETVHIAVVEVEPIEAKRGWFIGLGLAFALLGVVAIFLPFAASLVTTLVLGWLLVIAGVAQGIHAFQNRRWGGSGWAILGAMINVVAGLLVVAFPLTGTLALTLILAAYFTAEGILKIIRALQHRGMPAWGFFLFDGIVSLALGLLIGLRWPSTAVWAIGLLVGINLLIGGMSMLLIGAGAGAGATARARP